MTENDNVDVVTTQTDAEDTEHSEHKETTEKPAETPQQKKARLERQLKRVRKELGEEDEPEAEKPTKAKEPSDLDYGQKAFLKASGISGPDELQLAKDFMKRTGDSLDSIIEDDIFKGRLDKLRATKANEIAAAGDKDRARGTNSGDPVAKVLAKLGPNDPTPADLPREVREKVVEARRNLGKNAKMFYSD